MCKHEVDSARISHKNRKGHDAPKTKIREEMVCGRRVTLRLENINTSVTESVIEIVITIMIV